MKMIKEIHYHECTCDICGKKKRKEVCQELGIIGWTQFRLDKNRSLITICSDCYVCLDSYIKNAIKNRGFKNGTS